MRLLEEEKVYEIVERITNEAVEKKKPKYLIQKRIIAELSGLPVITIENDDVWRKNYCEDYDPSGVGQTFSP